MAKILFVLPRFHTNAVPWVRILKSAGHEVEVHCMIRGPTENHGLVKPCVFAASRCSMMLGGTDANDRRLFPAFGELMQAMRAARPDVVIVRGLTRWFMRMAAFAALLQGKALVVYDQEDPFPKVSTTWLRRAFCRLIGVPHFTPRIDDRVVNTPGAAIQIPFGCAFPEEAVVALSRRRLQWPPRILMVAKYRERKRHRDLLDALGRLYPSRQFVVTFCGEEVTDEDRRFCENLAAHARHRGIGHLLSFDNNVPHDKMKDVYAAHDIFVLPSIHEPAAVSPLEAVWCGCVAVVARGSGTRRYLPPSPHFDFVDGDVADLARALTGLLDGPATLESARELCIQRLSELANDRRILQCFESLL
jgi:glycosyltransferase involved in cell wall biosynthesis